MVSAVRSERVRGLGVATGSTITGGSSTESEEDFLDLLSSLSLLMDRNLLDLRGFES
jgi:hypothetical protein